IIAAWQDYFTVLKKDMQKAVGDVSFMADIWGNKALTPFLAMTAHWIAEDEKTSALELKVALIAFH
ncbi:hypothetical protein BJ138DRAFT_988574, partial [Hygrophoropsis aurantiaca]